jgi:hypothetical protein
LQQLRRLFGICFLISGKPDFRNFKNFGNLKCTERSASKIHLTLPALCIFRTIRPEYSGTGHPSVQELPSGHAFELRDEHRAEAHIVVTVGGRVMVAVSRAAVSRFVVPRAATNHTVRTLRWITSRQVLADSPVLFALTEMSFFGKITFTAPTFKKKVTAYHPSLVIPGRETATSRGLYKVQFSA